jgi:parallel beta-helix repeat protein
MKLIKLIFLLAFIMPEVSYGTNYYFSSSGNNSNNGKSAADAWKSLDKLNEIILNPGDSVLLKTGDIFIGQIHVKQSGSVQMPIVISSYGDKKVQRPYLTGATSIQKWLEYPLNSKMVYTVLGLPIKQLYLGNKSLVLARYPNFPKTLTTASGLSKDFIKESGKVTLTQAKDYWKGATVRYKSWPWLYEYGTVSGSNAGSLYISSVNGPRNGAQAGNPWYIENIKGQLDAPNEWYYDNTTNELIYYPANAANIQTSNVKAVILDNGITLDAAVSYVTVSNLIVDKFADCGFTALGKNTFVKLENCIFQNIEKAGVKFWRKSKNNLVSNCFIKDCRGRGISFTESSYNTIRNNVVKRIGLIPGHGISATNGAAGILVEIMDETGSNDYYDEVAKFNVVSRNVVDSCGYVGIRVDGENNLAEKNIISKSMITLDDGGGLYCYSNLTKFSKFRNNFVYSNSANSATNQGIYIDNSVHDVVVDGNTVANHPGTGICINAENYNDSVLNNVVFNNTFGIMYPDWGKNPIHDNITLGNTIVTLKQNAGLVEINSNSNRYNVGFFDKNYYVNPYGDKVFSYGWGQSRSFNLDQWRTAFPENDVNSVSVTNFSKYPEVNVFLFTNKSDTIRKVDVAGCTCTDLNKNPVEEITLAPFTSKVLLKNDLTKCKSIVSDPPIVLPNFNLPKVNYDFDNFADSSIFESTNGKSDKYEAENAIASGGGMNTNHPGYSGTGFWDNVDTVGNYIEFTVNSISGGSTNITCRFSSGTSNKTLSLYENGTKIRAVTFASTNVWDNWANKIESASLNDGNNTIRYQYDSGNNGYVNVDFIQIKPNITGVSIPEIADILNIYPNQVRDVLHIENAAA